MFLSCGDSLFDLFVGDQIDPNIKDPAGTFVSLSGNVGGSPMNVAFGLARLGHKSRYFTNLSSDVFGQRLRKFLQFNEVDISLCPDTDLNTTLAIVEKASDGSARYVFYTDNSADVSITQNDLPAQLPTDIRVLHFGSYSTAVEPTASTLASFAKRESGSRFISYDPNLRTSIEPDIDRWRETFKAYSSSANLVKASDEDIEELFVMNSEDKFISDCLDAGAELVFITRGGDGSSGFTKDGSRVDSKGVSVNVVDTVGAGDTFQASLLHWLESNNHVSENGTLQSTPDIAAMMDFATRAAAITCTRAGADLPRLEEIQN